jgi:hypothetical protein
MRFRLLALVLFLVGLAIGIAEGRHLERYSCVEVYQ